jgi:hypothetical protein
MWKLFHETIEYVKTTDYFHGVIDGLTVLVAEILLLSICVPVILKLVERVRTRRLRVIVDFYLFQTFHWITRMFLDMADIKDPLPILLEEQRKNPQFNVGSHPAYGNLENIVFVLGKAFAEHEQFKLSLEKKTATDFQRYEATCDRCLTEIDRVIAMLSSLPKVQQEVFETRVLAYVLRDAIHDAAGEMEKRRLADPTCELRSCVQNVTKRIQTVFERRKRLTDSVFRNRHRVWVATLVVTTPYVVARRWIAIRWCRLHDKPYKDPYHPPYSAFLLAEWRERHGFALAQAAKVLGISEERYRDFEYAYRVPSFEEWEPLTKHLREEQESKPKPVAKETEVWGHCRGCGYAATNSADFCAHVDKCPHS